MKNTLGSTGNESKSQTHTPLSRLQSISIDEENKVFEISRLQYQENFRTIKS